MSAIKGSGSGSFSERVKDALVFGGTLSLCSIGAIPAPANDMSVSGGPDSAPASQALSLEELESRFPT